MIELFIYTFFLVLIIACVSLRQETNKHHSAPQFEGLFLLGIQNE